MAKKPAPFQRASIDLSPVEREWKTIFASEVEVEDIVADVGLITKKARPSEELVIFNEEDLFLKDDKVFAFVKRS
jgi:hypothetical protein